MTYANSEIPVLVECFKTSVNPSNAESLKQAENTLKEHSRTPGYVLRTLEIVGLTNVEEATRLAAAVNFKNSVRTSWVLHEEETPPVIIQDNERVRFSLQKHIEDIKRHLFTIVIAAAANIRKQLNEALGIIAKSDFHEKWPSLLPELVQNLDKPGTQIAVFEAMAAVFQPMREVTIDDCDDTMDYCQKGAAAKVLEVVQSMEGVAATAGNDKAALTAVCSVVRLGCDVLFSLNVHGLSLHMADLAESWMKIWKLWLDFHNDVLNETDPERESAEDAMKAQVVKCCHQFLEMQEEDIQPYLSTFVTAIWGLLVACTSRSGQDNLALSAIAFLTTVGRSTHHSLFATGETLRQICEGIVIPNVSFREDDEEAFEGNYVEYLRKDLEGSDTDTRRRAACDFIRTLVDRFPKETTEIVNSYIAQLLSKYTGNPDKDWPMKDCALHMVMALAVKGKTAAAGATSVNELVNIEQFFEEHVLPELSTSDVNERPVLKADGLRYIYLFRSRLPKHKLLAAFPTIMRLLQSDSNVVHSYASIVIERLLALRVPSAPATAAAAAAGAPPVAAAAASRDMHPLLVPADVSGHLQQLLELLFAALRKEDSTENEYVMRALMRVIVFVGGQIIPVAQLCLDLMTQKLLEVCRNPRFAGFNHCLFDAVAALICATASDAATLKALEDKLFPCFDHVLQAEVEEFQPYVFQIFALLIVKSQQLQRAYVDTMLKPFLQHHYWSRHGNIPALVILMQAYLQKAPQDIVEKQFVQPILGIFQMLLGLSRHYGDATTLLASILSFLPMQAVSSLLPQVFTLLFGVLTSPTRRSTKTTVGFITCVSRMICMHGAEPILGAMETSQGGSTRAVFTEVFPNNLDKISSVDDKRVVGIALTRALCEHDAFLADAGMWVKAMETLVVFLGEDTSITLADDLSESLAGILEYTNEFSQLSNARMPQPPCMSEVKAVMPFLAQSLSQLSQRRPGTVGPLLSGQGAAASAPLEQLRNYLTSTGAPIS